MLRHSSKGSVYYLLPFLANMNRYMNLRKFSKELHPLKNLRRESVVAQSALAVIGLPIRLGNMVAQSTETIKAY